MQAGVGGTKMAQWVKVSGANLSWIPRNESFKVSSDPHVCALLVQTSPIHTL